MDEHVERFFLSEKISKIRWVPENLRESDRFLTGSWDAATNFVKLWRLQNNEHQDDLNEYVTKCCDKIPFKCDISGMEFLDNEHVVTCGSDGIVRITQIQSLVEHDVLRQKGHSELLHKFNSGDAAPCTAISVYDNDVASVGEDGRLNVIDATTFKVYKQVLADSCALMTVAYINQEEILTANRLGAIKLFDNRANTESKETFMVSSQDEKKSNFVSCLTYHPMQKHIVLAGSQEGSITVWDLRKPGIPASYLSAHNSAITEIGFHRTDPAKLFTASEEGTLWQWTQKTAALSNVIEAQAFRTIAETENINPWLQSDRAKTRIGVSSLITDLRKSVNSFDANETHVICSSDNEVVYLLNIEFMNE